jgi:hypothetical protein
MTSMTTEAVATGELCSGCGEELVLERIGEAEFDLTCGCSCVSTLC